MSWLIVSPVFDAVTQDCYEESRDALEYMKGKVKIVGDLSGRAITRREVEDALKAQPEAGLAFWNHGSEDKLWGSEKEVVINLQNVGVLSGREVYTVACSFGKRGGVEAYKVGAKATWAYTEVVTYTTDAKEEFKEAFNHGIKRRADGFSWKECLEKTKKRMTELIDKLVAEGKNLAAACMRWDRDILVCYDAHPPETTCAGRKLAIRLLGPLAGWRVPRTVGVAMVLFLVGWGIAVHDFAHQVWELKGTVLSLEGGYVGLFLILISFILLTRGLIAWLRKR